MTTYLYSVVVLTAKKDGSEDAFEQVLYQSLDAERALDYGREYVPRQDLGSRQMYRANAQADGDDGFVLTSTAELVTVDDIYDNLSLFVVKSALDSDYPDGLINEEALLKIRFV